MYMKLLNYRIYDKVLITSQNILTTENRYKRPSSWQVLALGTDQITTECLFISVLIDNPRRKPKILGVFLNSENASMTPNFMVITKFYRRIQVKTPQTSFNCIIVFINSIYIILTNYT